MAIKTLEEYVEELPEDYEKLVSLMRNHAFSQVTGKTKPFSAHIPGRTRYRMEIFAKMYYMSLSKVLNEALLVGLTAMEKETIESYDAHQKIEDEIPF